MEETGHFKKGIQGWNRWCIVKVGMVKDNYVFTLDLVSKFDWTCQRWGLVVALSWKAGKQKKKNLGEDIHSNNVTHLQKSFKNV